MKPTTRWNWFKDTTYYTQGKPTTNKPRTAPPTSPEHKTNFANKCEEILFKYIYDNNIDILIDILNIMSDHELMLTLLHNIRIGGVYNAYETFLLIVRIREIGEAILHANRTWNNRSNSFRILRW